MIHKTGATLEQVRFGEYLRDRAAIDEHAWLAALADHWSLRQGRIGDALVARGTLTRDQVEALAHEFHDDLDVVEIVARVPRSEKPTLEVRPIKRGPGKPAPAASQSARASALNLLARSPSFDPTLGFLRSATGSTNGPLAVRAHREKP